MFGQGELSPDEHDAGPDYFGLSREDMGKYESTVVAYIVHIKIVIWQWQAIV